MNTVYLSGKVADAPVLFAEEGRPARLRFDVSVSHKTKDGKLRAELYTVNAWNKAALWGYSAIKQHQDIALEGYLTQRMRRFGLEVVQSVEITAREFFPGVGIKKWDELNEKKKEHEHGEQDNYHS